ncbi:superoxide reductase [Clostridia bacterium]|nr:superoxide reductase [Clostridia bacterium]
MKNERAFFKCTHCGKVAGVVTDGGGKLICCGEEMGLLQANTTDAAQEKHVPVAVREGNTLKVQVGSVAHPMTAEHHIAWIAIAQGNKTQRVALAETGEPKAEFTIEDGAVTVYEYCNLHGLWATEA